MTADDVKMRFIEAVDTERRLPSGAGGGKSGFWPDYFHTTEDMNGWGTKRLAEEREMRLRRIPPSAAAISRYFEVIDWKMKLIDSIADRDLIWDYARCAATGRSFSSWCEASGIDRVIAYRRIKRICKAISVHLNQNAEFLAASGGFGVLQQGPALSMNAATLAGDDDGPPPAVPTSMITERPVDLLTSPAAMAAFAKHLAQVNKRRRRSFQQKVEIEAKRRAKLGLEPAAT